MGRASCSLVAAWVVLACVFVSGELRACPADCPCTQTTIQPHHGDLFAAGVSDRPCCQTSLSCLDQVWMCDGCCKLAPVCLLQATS